MLAWFLALLGAGFVGGMLTLAILNGRATKWTRLGTVAGVAVGIGLCIVRLSTAQDVGQILFAIGFTIMEIAAVLLLELQAVSLRTKEAEWEVRHEAEGKALARREAAAADLDRWQSRLQELAKEIADKIASVEDRHNRHIHIAELEAVAIKAVVDGYYDGIAHNIGIVHGVTARPS
jgi:hypothetical protein